MFNPNVQIIHSEFYRGWKIAIEYREKSEPWAYEWVVKRGLEKHLDPSSCRSIDTALSHGRVAVERLLRP